MREHLLSAGMKRPAGEHTNDNILVRCSRLGNRIGNRLGIRRKIAGSILYCQVCDICVCEMNSLIRSICRTQYKDSRIGSSRQAIPHSEHQRFFVEEIYIAHVMNSAFIIEVTS